MTRRARAAGPDRRGRLARGAGRRACAQARVPRATRSSSRWPTPPINLDPRVGADEASQKAHQLLYSTLVRIDADCSVVPELAESLELPDPITYIARLRQRRALSQRPRADVGGRRLHVSELSRSRVPRTIGRLSAAGGGRGERSLHRRVHAEGTVRLVSDQSRDGDRAGGIRRRERAPADRHRALQDEVVRAGRSPRARALRSATTASARRTPASC